MEAIKLKMVHGYQPMIYGHSGLPCIYVFIWTRTIVCSGDYANKEIDRYVSPTTITRLNSELWQRVHYNNPNYSRMAVLPGWCPVTVERADGVDGASDWRNEKLLDPAIVVQICILLMDRHCSLWMDAMTKSVLTFRDFIHSAPGRKYPSTCMTVRMAAWLAGWLPISIPWESLLN